MPILQMRKLRPERLSHTPKVPSCFVEEPDSKSLQSKSSPLNQYTLPSAEWFCSKNPNVCFICAQVGEQNGHDTGREDGLRLGQLAESSRPGQRFQGLRSQAPSAPHRSQALLRTFLQQEAPALHHLGVRQLEGAQDLGRDGTSRSAARGAEGCGGLSPAPLSPHTHLGQLQGTLVLDAVVGQGQPEQGAVEPEALRGQGGAVSWLAPGRHSSRGGAPAGLARTSAM